MRIQALPGMGPGLHACKASLQGPAAVSFSVSGPNLANDFSGSLSAGSTYVSLALQGGPPYYVSVGLWNEGSGMSYGWLSTVQSSNAVVTYIPIFTGSITTTLLVRTPSVLPDPDPS